MGLATLCVGYFARLCNFTLLLCPMGGCSEAYAPLRFDLISQAMCEIVFFSSLAGHMQAFI